MSGGIKLRLKKGDLELEIEVGPEVSEDQLKIIQQILEPFAGVKRKRSNVEGESVYQRLKKAILTVFKNGGWFTSADAKEIYEDFYGEEIELSTCSTYLRRMEKEGLLEARRPERGRIVEYRVKTKKVVEAEITVPVALESE